MLQPGDRISSWEILRPIGAGGMGTVFLCRDTLGAQIEAAVKVNAMLSPEGRRRFMREVEALSAIEHPGIVGLRSWGEDTERGLLWLAMEHLQGQNLEQRLEQGAMPVDEVEQAFVLLARALQHAHSGGVFHRDVKPANIVLAAGGPRLVDFGIAFQEDRTRLTTENQVPGTLAYMPPELISATTAPDPHLSDIYALGTILFEALTGRPALDLPEGLSDRQRFAKVMASKLEAKALDPGVAFPAHLRELVRRATAPDPSARLDDWDTFTDLLEGRGAAKSSARWGVVLGVAAMALVVLTGLFVLRGLADSALWQGTALAEPEVLAVSDLSAAGPGAQAATPAVAAEAASAGPVEPPRASIAAPATSLAAASPKEQAPVSVDKPAPVAPSRPPTAGELWVTVGGAQRSLQISEIIYAARKGADTELATTGGSFLVEQTITDLDRDITDSSVLRVHRDYLVNARHVSALADGIATTSAGEVPVSQRYNEPLRSAAGL